MIRRILLMLSTAILGAGLALAQGRVVLLIGPPASGKSTQAAFLQKQYGFAVVSADDLIEANPQAFNKRKATGVDNIEPHSDPVMNELVREKVKGLDLSKGLVLDGYPATKDHADYLVKLRNELGLTQPATIIQLEVPDDVIRKRVKKSKDPAYTPNVLEQRLKDYRRELEMIHLYFPQATIHKVDGTKNAATVSKSIQSILGK
jgi:adenylate kinase